MKHLLSANDLSYDDAIKVLDTARELSLVTEGPVKKLPTLRGRTVVNLFFEDSTRTRISFEAAAKRLSADVINFSSFFKDESNFSIIHLSSIPSFNPVKFVKIVFADPSNPERLLSKSSMY